MKSFALHRRVVVLAAGVALAALSALPTVASADHLPCVEWGGPVEVWMNGADDPEGKITVVDLGPSNTTCDKTP